MVSCYLASAPLSLFISSYLPALTLGIFTICLDETSLLVKISCACQLKTGTCLSTKNWHLTRAFASDWITTRAGAIFFCRYWTLCYCHCRPSMLSEGNSGWGVRHNVLQGNWWNRCLVIYFQELISWWQSLHLFISRKSVNVFIYCCAISCLWLAEKLL